MSILQLCAIAVCASFLGLCIRHQNKEYASVLSVAAVLLIFFYTLQKTSTIVHTVVSFAETAADNEIISTLMRALGIACITQLSADICREAGDVQIGIQIERFGKLEIVLLSLPLVARVLEIAGNLLT